MHVNADSGFSVIVCMFLVWDPEQLPQVLIGKHCPRVTLVLRAKSTVHLY